MRADLRERPAPAAEAPARPARPGASAHELDLGALRSIAGFHMARASVPALDAFERHVGAPHALHKVEFSLLMLLQANPAVSPKALARALAIAAPKLTALLDRLQQRGLLQRRPNPSDGRSQLVDLTAQGQRLAAQAARAAAAMEDELAGWLTPAEHAMLIELLAKLTRSGRQAAGRAD